MTRFIMFLDDAVSLLIEACKKAIGGEIFVLKMVPINLGDLADSMLKHYSNKYPSATQEEIGMFEGEKQYEELLDLATEGDRTVNSEKMFMVLPTYSHLLNKFGIDSDLIGVNIPEEEISSDLAIPISREILYELLMQHKILT